MGNRRPDAVIEGLTLLLAVLRAALRDRSDLLTENLLLRHQLTVLARPGIVTLTSWRRAGRVP
jgi:hypothetical protein